MRPYHLAEKNKEPLEEGEVSRARLHKPGDARYTQKSSDILSAFMRVLGKKVSNIPDRYKHGESVIDPAMDPETNTSRGIVNEVHSLLLEPGSVAAKSVVKIAQTYRSGTNDIDYVDILEMFLSDENQVSLDTINDLYVLNNFRPVVTQKNWRMDCGVAGYDNRSGLPPFFPTKLRCEDYVYQLWLKQEGIVAAHIDAAQHHIRSNYMRDPVVAEFLNEQMSNLLKRQINATLESTGPLSIGFGYDGEVTFEDTRQILDNVKKLYSRAITSARKAKSTVRARQLQLFATNLKTEFSGFEPDLLRENLLKDLRDNVKVIKASLRLWPDIVAISDHEKSRSGLPKVYVHNQTT
jgi:hypothetical protein